MDLAASSRGYLCGGRCPRRARLCATEPAAAAAAAAAAASASSPAASASAAAAPRAEPILQSSLRQRASARSASARASSKSGDLWRECFDDEGAAADSPAAVASPTAQAEDESVVQTVVSPAVATGASEGRDDGTK